MDQTRLYIDINNNTARYMEGVVAAFVSASEVASREINGFFKSYAKNASAGKGYYYWGVTSGAYFRLRNNIEEVIKRAYSAAYTDMSACFAYIVDEVYNRVKSEHIQLNSTLPDVPLPYELKQVLCNRNKGTMIQYNNIQGRTRDVFGDISYWVPNYNSVFGTLERNKNNTVNIVLSTLGAYLLGNRKPKVINNRIQRLIGTYQNNKVTGALAKCVRQLRTESMRCMSAATLAAAFSLYGKNSDLVQKEWHSFAESEMEGTRVNLLADFEYPDRTKTLYPGVSGSPRWDINTKCYITIVPREEL